MSRTALSLCSLSLSLFLPMAFSLCFLVRHCEALSRCRASPRGCELLPILIRGLKRVPLQSVHANFLYDLKPSVAIIHGSEPSMCNLVATVILSTSAMYVAVRRKKWRRVVATIVNSSNVERLCGRCETETCMHRWELKLSLSSPVFIIWATSALTAPRQLEDGTTKARTQTS